jgi:hypothetical protein
MTTRNWNHDVTISKTTGQKCYETKDLIKKFRELEKDGYSGLSLGLVIDIVDHQIPAIDFSRVEK